MDLHLNSGQYLNALNFVERVFNEKVHPELKWMTVRNGHLLPILPRRGPTEDIRLYITRLEDYILPLNRIPDIDPEKGQLKTLEDFIQNNYSPFQRPILCVQGTPINDEGESIAPEAPEELHLYWVGIRTSNRNTITSFRGSKIQATAITIVMGVEVTWIYNPPTDLGFSIGDKNSIPFKRPAARRIAFDILEFLERRSLFYFRKAHRLRNEISMTDEFRNEIAYRRFTVIINA